MRYQLALGYITHHHPHYVKAVQLVNSTAAVGEESVDDLHRLAIQFNAENTISGTELVGVVPVFNH